MYALRDLLDRRLVRDLLNGIALTLEVQCAALDRQGRAYMCGDVPAPSEGLPFDAPSEFKRAGLLDAPTNRRWRAVFREALGKARKDSKPGFCEFELDEVRLCQFFAPVTVDVECLGYIASGMIPVGGRDAGDRLAALLEHKTTGACAAALAAALRSVGVLPKRRLESRLALVAQAAQAASRIAKARQRLLGERNRALRQMAAVEAVIQAVNREQDEEAILRVIVDEGFRLVDADRGMIDLYDPSRNMLVIKVAVASGHHAKAEEGTAYLVTKGISGWVFRNREPALVRDILEEGKWRRRYHKVFPGTRAELAVPLLYGDEALGVLNVESETPGAFCLEHQKTLSTLAKHAVTAILKARLIETRTRQLQAFAEATSTLAAPYKLADTLRALLEQAAIALGGSLATLQLYDEQQEALRFVAIARADGSPGPKWDRLDPASVRGKRGVRGISGKVFADQRSRIVRDASQEPDWVSPPWKARSGVYVPLATHLRPLGVMAVDSPEPGAFVRESAALLEKMATGIAVAVENAWHDELVRRIGEILSHALRSPAEDMPSTHRNRALSGLAKAVWEVMKPRACSVIVRPESWLPQKSMTIPEGCEFGVNRKRPLRLRPGAGLCGRAMRLQRPVEVQDVRASRLYADRALARRSGLVSALAVPIMSDGIPAGALLYYSGMRRPFSEFERFSLKTICGIAGMISAVNATERVRRLRCLDYIGTGVTLIGVPDDWEERCERRLKDPDGWNRDLQMPILFMNAEQESMFAPKAKRGMLCYRAFNTEKQGRPCWWCPVLRAMMTGRRHTSYTHSPAFRKRRTEHFKVTASALREGGRVIAAIESVSCETTGLEAEHFLGRLNEATSTDDAFALGAECLGRGTRADYVLFIKAGPSRRQLSLGSIWTPDREVLREERSAPTRSEWTRDTPLELPPREKYFDERGALFVNRPRHPAMKKPLGSGIARLIRQAMLTKRGYSVVQDRRALSAFAKQGLPRGIRKAVLVCLGPRRRPWGCAALLDKMPDGHKDHGIDPQWCLKICRQLVIKVENIGLASESDVMRTLIEIAPVGVVRTDAIGKVVNVNREWRRTFGGNITGRNILTLSSVKRVGLDRPWRQALKGRPTEWVAASFRSVFGKYVVVTIKCAPIAGSRGKGVAGLLFCCWDLTEFTERREAQFTREQARSLGDLAAGAVHELKSPAKAAEYATAAFAEGLGEVLRRYRRVCELQLVPDVLGKVNGAVRSLVKVASAREGVLPLPSADAVRAATRLAEGHGLRCSPEQVRDLAAVGLATELDELLNVKGTQATRSLFGFLTSLSRTVIACSDAKNAISQIDGVARALKAHGFIAPGRPQWTDIREPLDAALVVFRRSFDRADVTCRVRCSRRVPLIHCVPGALVQALSSIFQNCVDAICKVRRRGRVDVSIRKSHNSVVVMIDNNGKPLPATTDPTELGTTLPPLSEGRVRGYGCWVVRETIAVMHKGRVGMQRLRGGSGTRVQFVLPIDPFASGGAKQQK